MAEKKFVWVRSIYGKDFEHSTAKEQYAYIPDNGMNDVIADWHAKQAKRPYDVASPSRILTCPRVIWLHNQGVEPTNSMGWGTAQRLMAGRMFENLFARQLADKGMLLHHWADNPEVPELDRADKFTMGEGLDRLEGVPDYLLKLPTAEQVGHSDNMDITGGYQVAVSDAKTSRSDSFGYVPIDEGEFWTEWQYYKMRIQLTAYYMLCHANKDWFDDYEVRYTYPHPETDPDGGESKEVKSLSLPEVCHVFVYSLDDGIVRREFTWTPTKEDMDTVKKMTRRFNEAVASKEPPECKCRESFDEFDVKFCAYSTEKQGKIGVKCCGDELIPQEKLV